MSEITKYEPASGVTKSLLEFVVAKINKPPLSQLSDLQFETVLSAIILRSYVELGHSAETRDSDVTFIRESLLKRLRAPKYETITVEEISLFISKGINREYPTFNGQLNVINVQNIMFWINTGIASEERKQALKEFYESQVKTSDKPVLYTPESLKKMTLEAFDDFKKDGKMPFIPFVIYDQICARIGVEIEVSGVKVKTLIPDREKAKEVYAQAKKDYVVKRNEEAKRISAVKEKVDEILELKTEGSRELFSRFLKGYYLRCFFEGLVSANKSLEL